VRFHQLQPLAAEHFLIPEQDPQFGVDQDQHLVEQALPLPTE
jgi:hypothetical protein